MHIARSRAGARKTFAEHPMLNLTRREEQTASTRRSLMHGGQAYVIAKIVLLADLAPDPAGSTLDTLGSSYPHSVIGEAILIYATSWPHELHSTVKRAAANEPLAKITVAVRRTLWRNEVLTGWLEPLVVQQTSQARGGAHLRSKRCRGDFMPVLRSHQRAIDCRYGLS
jgi:hypothetical protein